MKINNDFIYKFTFQYGIILIIEIIIKIIMFSIRKPTILETFKNKYNVILKEAWLDSCISQFTTNQNTSAPELLDTFVFSRFLDSRLSNSTNPSLDLSTKHFHILEIIDIQDVGISKFKLYTAIKLKNDARNQTTQINLLNNSIYAQKILNQASEIKRSGLQDGNLPGQGVHPGQGPQGHGQDQGNDDDFFEFGDENDKE
ncbi:hypothetical protein AX774_g2752 [Zancudomyces culisetae]|uniref:RMI1 N-terminal domain-containing protein n=1 Tax=Zancudomyces culisetae TaxID=1213189 RepID=A0A1R1PS08_ZANCU|nr:hypothetical protein AX774_g2752 [Zancudomyces culisetae]|eukprot:OMH83738.1 hypothetical protein AX774_g2752 [Zancudomyces culisetae]